jgi:tetratricopeptide (TPR) repeat protein
MLTAMGRDEEALAAFENAAELVPEAPEIWNNLGELLARMGRPAEAIERFDKAIEADEKFAPAWFGKARVLLNTGKKKDGKQAARRFLRLAAADDPRARMLRKVLEEE